MYNKILKNKKININIKPFFVKRYNDIMLLLHVRGSNNFLSIRPLHYFNDILYTAWPFYIGWSVFFFLFFFLMLMKQIAIAYYLILISFFSLLWMLGGWFYDMIIESFVYGKYSRKLRQAINYGFLLFLVSEAFLFFGFFLGIF